MPIQPYLFFGGKCEEAIDFYKKAVGAEVVRLLRFKDNPEPGMGGKLPPGSEDKVMHAELKIRDASILMSDGHVFDGPKFHGFSITLIVPDVATADRMFPALLEGGKVTMPLAKTFFSAKFGMGSDKFGLSWQVYVGE